MLSKAKYFILISLTFAMLIGALMQSACHKEKEATDYISQEDFIRKLQGIWYITFFDKNLLPDDINVLEIYLAKDSLRYNSVTETWYSQNDSVICTLPDIEYVQNWRITGNNDSLILKTEDLCGVTKSYII